jgi:GDP-D-mannose dehydratase
VLGRREAVIWVGNIDLQRDFTDVRDVAEAYGLLADQERPVKCTISPPGSLVHSASC